MSMNGRTMLRWGFGIGLLALGLTFPAAAQKTDLHFEHYDKPVDWKAKGQELVQDMPDFARNGTPKEKAQFLAAEIALEMDRNSYTVDHNLGTRYTTARSLKCSEIAKVLMDAFKALEAVDPRIRTFQVAVRNNEAGSLDMNATHVSMGVMLDGKSGYEVYMIDLWQFARENGRRFAGFGTSEWNCAGYLAWCNQMMMDGYDDLCETVEMEEEEQTVEFHPFKTEDYENQLNKLAKDGFFGLFYLD